MKFRRFLMLPALLGGLVWAGPARAQGTTGTVVGRVLDAETNRPVPSAQVVIVGARRGIISSADGTFVLAGVPAGLQVVRAVVLGYADKDVQVTVAVGQTATVNFLLQPEAVALKELLAVGYGTQRRADLTGSVASVKTDALQRLSVASLQQSLQGTVAGVNVVQGDAAPGGGIRVQIRGTNSMNSGSAKPLYVIDGVPFGEDPASKRTLGAVSEENLSSLTDTNPLSTLSPSDIESIEILKDASATAIYGSRGANGVIIVTTRKGRLYSGGQFTLNYSQGYSSVVSEIPVLNAYEFANYVNTAFVTSFGPTSRPYGDRPGSLTPDSIRKIYGAGTDWQNLIFRTALTRDGQLGFSGGDELGSYAITGNLLQQQGVIRGSEFSRGGLRVNLDRSLNQRLRVSSNLSVTRSLNDMVRSSTINGYRSIGIVQQALAYVPMTYQDTSKKAVDPRAEDPTVWASYGANPLRYTDEVQESDQQTRGLGGLKAIYTLGNGLALDLSVGGNYERRTYQIYFPRTVNEGYSANGDAVQAGSEYSQLVSTNLIRYNHGFGEHHRFDAVAGFEYTTDKSTWMSEEVQNFADDILGANVLQNGTGNQKPQTGLATSQLSSVLGRANYAFKDRYLVTATFRADGSSKFAANNKWAYFPSFAVAWRAIDEPFLRNNRFVSDLKLRASYGKTGNQAIGAYQSLPAISGTTMTLNEAVVPAYIVTQLGNPNLKWETTDQFDYGVDFGAFGNRLTGTVDYYRKNTFDLLQAITLAGNTGFGNAWINSGNVTNRGIELQAGYDILTGKSLRGLTWNISANATHNVNKIVSLGPITQQFAGRLGAGGNLEAAPFIQKPGYSIGTMWGYKTNGLVRTTADSIAYAKMFSGAFRVGDIRYADVNGDGKIDASDQTKIGDANPNWLWGLNNRFTLGKFDLSALVTAVKGASIINTERMRAMNMDGSMNIPSEWVNNAFSPTTNPNGTFPMIRQDRKGDARFHDMYIEDGSYVRIKNIQLGYKVSLPRLQNARVYVNAINVWTWTKYDGFDPEVSAFNSADRPGVDQGSYPQARLISIGFTTTF